MTLLSEAESLINGQRRQDYGEPKEMFERIAGFWSTYTGTSISSHDVVNMMILMKVARLGHSPKYDSYLDIAGYAGCAELLGYIAP